MIRQIVSGGQTGADRAALDWALGCGFECGGWCPAGRLAEDGPIDGRYPLRETPSAAYAQRTEWNVRDSDGTLLFSLGSELTGGTALTRQFATAWKRPCLWISKAATDDPAGELEAFADRHFIEILNVAGPRESTEPGIGTFVSETLDAALGAMSP
ncbi:MAG: putative molybdenum carrier protein [Verrucomicrobiales bacterium]